MAASFLLVYKKSYISKYLATVKSPVDCSERRADSSENAKHFHRTWEGSRKLINVLRAQLDR
jgi:hypothetical protein